MVKPVAKTQAYMLHPWLVRAHHEWYDTTQETQKPDVIRTSTSYHIQWQNIAESFKKFPKAIWDIYNPMQINRGQLVLSAVAYVGATPTGIKEGGGHATIANYNFYHDATGADIIVIGSSADGNGQTITSSYNGSACTTAKNQTGNRTAYIGYLASPPSGSNEVIVNFTSGNDAGIGVAVTYSGSAGTMSGGTGSTGTTQNFSDSVTSSTGDMVFDFATCGTVGSVTASGGQTSRLSVDDAYWHLARASDEPGAVSVGMGWDRSTTANYCHACANIDKSTGGGSTNTSHRRGRLTLMGVG